MRRTTVFATDEAHLDGLLKIVEEHGVTPTGVWRNLLSFEIPYPSPALIEALSYQLADIEDDESEQSHDM